MASRTAVNQPVATQAAPAYRVTSPHPGDTRKDSLEFISQQGGNGSLPTYQEATGAPIETTSPLGLDVSWLAIIGLNINQMIGTGVFSTPSTILKGTGSVGLSLIFWVIGGVISACGLAVYTELAAYFPSRSGSEAVYLEQAYPRPRYFFPVTFAIQSVILSYSSSNALVLAQYLFKMAGHTATPWEQKGVAIAAYTVATLFVVLNNRVALWTSNAAGIIKVLTLIIISITGLVVLGGHTRVEDPHLNFRDAFAGASASGYGVANALYKITFSYSGYANAFNVVAEVKDPIRTIRKSAPASLLLVTILYVLCNVAYFAAVPKVALKGSSQTAATLFFTAVFGSKAAKGLNFLVVISAFGNLVGVLIGQSRLLREVGRQGTLPYPRFWSSTRPFGTPLGAYLLKWVMTLIMIVAPPAGDAFNFIVDLAIYPASFFLFLMTLGIYFIRRQRERLGLGRAEYHAWDVAIIFFLAVQVFLLIMPWYPPLGGRYGGDVSFWYGTYAAVGLGIIALCAIYYWIWIWLLPRRGNYTIRGTVIELADGAITHALIKVPNEKLEQWDATHDAAGNAIGEEDKLSKGSA